MNTSDHFNHERTYLSLRRTVGFIGVALPFVLMIGNALLFDGDLMLHSISRYYHTGMRDVFVGGLCGLGLFLFFYSGYDRWEDWTGNIAGFLAIGTALFPVSVGEVTTVGKFHYLFAGLLFVTLAHYSMHLFPRRRFHGGGRERMRATIHRVCGAILISSIAAVIIHSVGEPCDKSTCSFTMIVETVALIAFGISWLLEGHTLADQSAGVISIAA